jgi:hypothetical protein
MTTYTGDATVKVNTAELEGVALDWAVGRACKMPVEICPIYQYGRPNGQYTLGVGQRDWDGAEVDFSPSTDAAQGGTIIEDERIDTIGRWETVGGEPVFSHWLAIHPMVRPDGERHAATGPTLLIAAMRCFATAAFGEWIDVPDKLVTKK